MRDERKLAYVYAAQDAELAAELAVHLRGLQHDGVLGAVAGLAVRPDDEDAPLMQALADVQIALLLVSPDLLASGILQEPALAEHVAQGGTFIPVLLRPADYRRNRLIGELASTPRDGRPITLRKDRDEAFTEVASELRGALEARARAARIRARAAVAPLRLCIATDFHYRWTARLRPPLASMFPGEPELLEVWSPEDTPPGAVRADVLRAALQQADLVLLPADLEGMDVALLKSCLVPWMERGSIHVALATFAEGATASRPDTRPQATLFGKEWPPSVLSRITAIEPAGIAAELWRRLGDLADRVPDPAERPLPPPAPSAAPAPVAPLFRALKMPGASTPPEPTPPPPKRSFWSRVLGRS